MIKILELMKKTQLWFKKCQFFEKILLFKANVIIFYSAHNKGRKAFIWGNVQIIYDFTFPANTILLFWHVLKNMQNVLRF